MNNAAEDAVFMRGIRGQILILKITGMACCLRPLCTAPVIAQETQNLHNKQRVSGANTANIAQKIKKLHNKQTFPGANTANIAQKIKKLHNKQTFPGANLPDIAPELFVLLENIAANQHITTPVKTGSGTRSGTRSEYSSPSIQHTY